MELLQQAQTLYRAGDMHDALEVAQAACERKPHDAEAWWLLGCISRHTEMPAASEEAFRRAAQLSKRRPAPLRVGETAFQKLVDDALAGLSRDARKRLAATRVQIAQLPAAAAVRAGVSPDALVLRVRQPEDVLTLFQVNFENRSAAPGDLAKLVGRTLAKA